LGGNIREKRECDLWIRQALQESLDLLSRLWSLFIKVVRGDFRRKKLRNSTPGYTLRCFGK
jgi:hypothetical protein